MDDNNLDPNLVQGGPAEGAATPAAPSTPAEPVAPATPSAPPSDADAQRMEMERKLAQYENDIRALKSTSDKRLNEAQNQWAAQKRQLEREMQTLRMASMDDDERKRYETELAQEQQQELIQELEHSRQASQDYEARINALQYFLSKGVPADRLTINQGYDALFNSGMDWLEKEIQRLRTSTPATPSSSPAQPLPAPPVVATSSQGVPNVKPTWDDLHKRYGDDDEKIYRMVEAGLLPRDIIPG